MMNSSHPPTRARRPIAMILTLAPLFASCMGGDGTSQEPVRVDQAAARFKIDPRMYESPEWIDTYSPEKATKGYTLVLYKRRIPMLIDMDGKVVHAWQGVRAVGRARLLPSGHLAVIGESGRLEEYDWQGQRVWSFALPDDETFLHHDFIQLENANYLLLGHDPAKESDFLLEVDRAGEIIWRWNSHEHLQLDFSRAAKPNNKTHINSVHELPSNRGFDDGHEALRPGNILISARNLNALYIVARPEGDVVWQHLEGLDYQHEAIMIPPGTRGAGNILLFNNGYHDLEKYRQSAIVELNPVDKKVVWKYRRRGFYSSTGGTQQTLPNGNLLVTSSQGGRVFELTRDGRIVWQWSPPHMPMRASRYPENYCPELQELGPPSAKLIENRDPDTFIDKDLYTFSLPHQTRRVKVRGESRFILKDPNRCQVLQIPAGTELLLGYGAWTMDQETETPFVSDEGPARFGVTLRPVDGTETQQIFDRTVDLSLLIAQKTTAKAVLVNEKIPLGLTSPETVEICLSLESVSGGPTLDDFIWEEPMIRRPGSRAPIEAELAIDAEALEKQEKHLKAIGYID